MKFTTFMAYLLSVTYICIVAKTLLIHSWKLINNIEMYMNAAFRKSLIQSFWMQVGYLTDGSNLLVVLFS